MSSTQRIKCGYCSKSIPGKQLEENFKAVCSVCQTEHNIKPTCAFKLYADAVNLDKGYTSKISLEAFKQTNVTLFCHLCQDKCFYCKVKHTGKSNLS